jgi:hypothetical protein
MEVFGDESGGLRNLLNGECSLFVIGVVAGEATDCVSCPKRAIRKTRDLSEAKWNDMRSVQKRRFIDCLVEQSEIEFGYVALREQNFQGLENCHHIYQNSGFRFDWDLCVIGYAYSILLQRLPSVDSDHTFTFDKFYQTKQSDQIAAVIEEEMGRTTVTYGSSHQIKGIQAADCFAGAVAEHLRGGTQWLDAIDDIRIYCSTDDILRRIEKELLDNNTGP